MVIDLVIRLPQFGFQLEISLRFAFEDPKENHGFFSLSKWLINQWHYAR
jgi:hypothetical protein